MTVWLAHSARTASGVHSFFKKSRTVLCSSS